MSETELRLRVVFGDRGMIGPGKADLLQHIRDTGSISAAGREMGMSYKRAWNLVETMNAMFAAPLVSSARGGAKGGGAELTEMGHAVLREYRDIEDRTRHAVGRNIRSLEGMLSDMSDKE